MKLYWPNSDMPHGYVCETPVHLVYRLAGCLPVGVLKELTADLVDQLTVLRKQHPPPTDRIEVIKDEYLSKYDDQLDAQDQSKYILIDPKAIQVVLDSWEMLHNKRACKIHLICIMGNHVHVIISAWPDEPDTKLGSLMRRHKTFTNKQLHKLGSDLAPNEQYFWAEGFFDRYIRPDTYEIVYTYVLDNPTKAGIHIPTLGWPGFWIP